MRVAATVAGRFELSFRNDKLSFTHPKHVAGRFELLRRRNNLSFAHHQDVAALRYLLPPTGAWQPRVQRPQSVKAVAVVQG
jgi:hypothetical protein